MLTFDTRISPMCSGGVTVTIIGVDVDAAMEPILTLFSGNNSAGNGVRRSCIQIELVIHVLHNCTTVLFLNSYFLLCLR